MTDAIKIAAKTALIAIITAGIIALFATIEIPALNITAAAPYIQFIYNVCCHYFTLFPVLWGLGITVISLELAISVFNLGMIAVRWIMKVNE